MPYATEAGKKAYQERIKPQARVWARANYWKHHESRLEKKAKYREEHREEIRPKQLAATQENRKKYPEKWKARWAVSNAVRGERLPRVQTMACVDCGKPATRYDHYKGYAAENRLDVQPVCHRCDGVRKHQRGEMRKYV